MKVGIIGAGWLGAKYKQLLQEVDQVEVKFTNRKTVGEDARHFSFTYGQPIPHAFLNELDYLFICSTLPKDNSDALSIFVQQLKTDLPLKCTIVFTSTIGVYASNKGVVDETSESLKVDSVYCQMEKLLLSNFSNRSIITRLGGLIGEDRHPITSLAGREGIQDGQHPVNLIHRNDILTFFECIRSGSVESGIYNLVYPVHPLKADYYVQKAIDRNLVMPTFNEGTSEGKIVSTEKALEVNGFEYKFPI